MQWTDPRQRHMVMELDQALTARLRLFVDQAKDLAETKAPTSAKEWGETRKDQQPLLPLFAATRLILVRRCAGVQASGVQAHMVLQEIAASSMPY